VPTGVGVVAILHDTGPIIDDREERTVRLAEHLSSENIIALRSGPDFLDELNGLSQSKRLFDVVVVDCTISGFLFTADTMIESASLAKNVLEVQGAMVFVKADKAIAMIKESVVGLLTFHVFETLSQVYDYSPSLARSIQNALGQKTDLWEQSSDLSEQILMSSVAVLTSFGIKLKAGMESTKRRNMLLSSIDNYTPLSSIAHKLAPKMDIEDLQDELHSLEESGAIFPIFPRIPFLVHCFRNKLPFKLKDYLIESRLITQDQLDNLYFQLAGNKASERLSLGALCVDKGLISSRQLEIALQDQAFYGQGGENEKVKIMVDQDSESKVHSLVGHLGSTEAAGVLQSLSNNRETGVLSVEHKDIQFRAVFEQGRLLKARQGRLRGNEAVIEFISTWREGIFVFLERPTPSDLADPACSVTKPVDKMMLDSALAADNIEAVWKRLPKGADTALEKLDDYTNLFGSGNMVDPQERTPLTTEDIAVMQRLWKEFDGLASISHTVKKIGTLTTLQAAFAVARLLHYNLAKIPAADLAAPLAMFQSIVIGVTSRMGTDRTNALLRLSLQASQGYSAKARMFQIGTNSEVGVDLSLARSAGTSLSEVIKQLEDWQVSYIEYVSQEMDKNALREIVAQAYRK
jgi:hypothetical protein